MPSKDTSAGIHCPANKWTNVLWFGGVLVYKSYSVSVEPGSVQVKYRRYGGPLPPYWSGSFTGTRSFGWYPWDLYVRLDIKPPQDVTVNVR